MLAYRELQMPWDLYINPSPALDLLLVWVGIKPSVIFRRELSLRAISFRSAWGYSLLLLCSFRDHPQLKPIAIESFAKKASLVIIAELWEGRSMNKMEPFMSRLFSISQASRECPQGRKCCWSERKSIQIDFYKGTRTEKRLTIWWSYSGGSINAAWGLNMVGSDSYVITLRKKAQEGELM